MARRRKESKQGSDEKAVFSNTAFGVHLRASLIESCLRNAETALAASDGETAMHWMAQVSEEHRPKTMVAAIQYQLAKHAASKADWALFQNELISAVQTHAAPLYQHRLALARRKQPTVDDDKWLTLCATVDPVSRLPTDTLKPLVTGVWSCGAYFSRGVSRGRPWSQLLRRAKNPAEGQDDREAVLSIASGFFCRFIMERTPLLSMVDAVVSIPANPDRFNKRRMSLPDELARGVEKQLAVPFVFTGLVYEAGADLDLRGLSWAERYKAVEGSMSAGDLGVAEGKNVLIVDDVITSGATISEAARLLREAGVSDVYAMTLCHTEG